MQRLALFITLLIICVGCNRTDETLSRPHIPSDNLFQYAHNIYSRPGSDTVIVYCMWEHSYDSITYVLSQNASPSFPEILNSPTNIALTSTSEIAFFTELKEIDKISGICDPFRTTNAQVQEKVKDGQIKNIGTSTEINQELLIALQPDILITTTYNKSDLEKQKKLQEKTKIPFVFSMCWQEDSPLARAEWIKFIGLLLGEYEKADSIFSEIEKNYFTIKSHADSINQRPIILAGSCTNNIWYLPGGKSYIATLISDAGGSYLFKDNQQTGSFSINFEDVLVQSQKADTWIGCDEKTKKELVATNKNFQYLSMYKTGKIYNRTKRSLPNGGNDFWEYGIVRPDLVLADYMKIIHPELLPDYETTFVEQIRE